MYKINVRQGKKINWPRQCDTFETRTCVSEFRQNITLLHHISTHYTSGETRRAEHWRSFSWKIFQCCQKYFRWSVAESDLRGGGTGEVAGGVVVEDLVAELQLGLLQPVDVVLQPITAQYSCGLTNEKQVLPAAWPARGRGTSARGSAGPGHNNEINEISWNSIFGKEIVNSIDSIYSVSDIVTCVAVTPSIWSVASVCVWLPGTWLKCPRLIINSVKHNQLTAGPGPGLAWGGRREKLTLASSRAVIGSSRSFTEPRHGKW